MDFTDLHRFWGKFGPPEADEVKKYAKTYVKKPKMRTNIHGRSKNERRLAGLWPERVDSRKLKVEYGVLIRQRSACGG